MKCDECGNNLKRKKYEVGFAKTFYFYKTVTAYTRDEAVDKARPRELKINDPDWADYGHHQDVESITELEEEDETK